MHVGINSKPSITKVVYYPSRSKLLFWISENEKKLALSKDNLSSIIDPEKKVKKNVKTTTTYNRSTV